MNIAIKNKEDNSKRSTRDFSSKQERAVAKKLGGKTTPNSGATIAVKGDVKTEDFLLDCKTKTKPSESISIKKEWIEKLKDEICFEGKPYWSLVFSFGEDQENYYIINEELFEFLMKTLQGE